MLSISGDFKKKQNKKQQTTSYWESFSSSFTNLQYGFKKYTSQITVKLFSSNQQQQRRYVIIQGKQYKNRTQAKKAVKEILWFSYRKGFNIKNQYTSDVGWGCLIRVGQMALASALVKYFKNQGYMNCVDFQNQVFAVTASFSDVQGRQQKYSLNKVIEIAQKQFQQKPGQWFDLSKIGYCLRTMQNKYPMKGSQNLQVVFFDQCLNIPTILNVQCLKQCACAKKKIVCQKCHSYFRPTPGQRSTIKSMNQSFHTLNSYTSTTSAMKKKPVCQQQQHHNIKVSLSHQNQNIYNYRHRRLKRDMMVILLTRANNNVNTDKAIFTLLDLNICLGIMTGFPKKAVFVVGRQESKLIYLDPHYVQQNSKFQELKSQTYFCQEYLLTERSALDPSMAFCFYIQTLYQLEILSEAIQKINRLYRQCLSLAVDNYKYSFNPHDYQEVQEDSMSLMSFSL